MSRFFHHHSNSSRSPKELQQVCFFVGGREVFFLIRFFGVEKKMEMCRVTELEKKISPPKNGGTYKPSIGQITEKNRGERPHPSSFRGKLAVSFREGKNVSLLFSKPSESETNLR